MWPNDLYEDLTEEECRERLIKLKDRYINTSHQIFMVDGVEMDWVDIKMNEMKKLVGGPAGLTPAMYLIALEDDLLMKDAKDY